MTVNYKCQTFTTDNDLNINILGIFPKLDITNPRLREIFREKYKRGFLGGDDIVAFAQSLVSGGMDFEHFQENILNDIDNPDNPEFVDVIFNKIATGIGRGHSLGGLAGVVLGINGSKMIDSGLTGLVSSRSLVTSSRRRETTMGEIIVPENIFKRKKLLNEYLNISKDVFSVAEIFKEKLGKSMGKQLFNKVIPYNNPADLFIVLPLDTLTTLTTEVRSDKNNSVQYLPRELHSLVDMLRNIAEEAGMGIMYRQRSEVQRDTYFHYNVFKNPSLPNYALEKAIENGMSLDPVLIDKYADFTPGFLSSLEKLERRFRQTREINDPKELAGAAMKNMWAMRDFVGEYNGALGVNISDSLSWRVWSEQKRHATLRQNVESVYSATERAYGLIKKFWSKIQKINAEGLGINQKMLDALDEAIIIDPRIKKDKDLLASYVYHTARQLMFYGTLREEGFEARDALYIVPKNIRVRTLENYDLINLIDLEHPLRLCSTCEPERYATSWKKRDVIAEAFPQIKFFLEPKCNIGYCTEGKSCGHVNKLRDGNYSEELHKKTKEIILSKAR